MILGAAQDNPKVPMNGQYKPWEFGRITLWQMKNIFGYGGTNNMGRVDVREAFWKRLRILKVSEFEIWCRWHDEVQSKMGSKP